MKTRIIAIICWTLWALDPASIRAEDHQPSPTTNGIARLVVWNHTDKPQILVVIIDGTTLYDSMIGTSDSFPKIVVNEEFEISAGKHTVRIHDKLRNIQKDIELTLTNVANINVFFDAEDTGVDCTFTKKPMYQ